MARYPGKRFGNVIADGLILESDDTSVSVALRVNGEVHHTGVTHFGSDANFSGDVNMSGGTLTVNDVDIVAAGGLTIATGASVDVDATDFSVTDIQIGGTLSIDGTSAGLSVGSGASVDVDATSVSFAGVVFVESTGSLRLEDTADYTSNAAAISAGYSAGDLYHAGSGVVKIVT